MSTAKVNFVINFRAAGNASALQNSIKGVTAATKQLNAVTTQGIRSKSPIDAVAKQFQARQMTAKQAGFAIRNMNAILKEHNALMRATGKVTLSASGAASTQLSILRGQSVAVATLSQRLMYLNTVLAASAKGMVAFGKQVQWAGRQVMIGLALPLSLVGTAASKAAVDFDRQMTRVVKVTNISVMRLKKMTEDGVKDIGRAYDILDTSEYGVGRINAITEAIQRQTMRLAEFGASVGFAAEETGKLAAEFAQMGYQGRALDELSKAALTLSRVSGAELQDSIQLSRLVVQAFGRDINDLTETFARLNMVENNTALSLAEMAGSIPIVASVAQNLGIEIEALAGMLAIMKEKGIAAREGATALRTGLIRLVQKPTRNAIQAFERINLNLEEMQQKHAGDITGFFVELSQTLYELGGEGQSGQARIEGFTQALSALTGVRASARFLSLVEEMRFLERVDLSGLSSEELEELGYASDEVVYQLNEMAEGFDENGLAARAMIGVFTEQTMAMKVYESELERVNNSLAGIQERLKAEMSVELAKLGRIFVKVTNQIRQYAVNLIRSFNNLSDSTKNTVLAITAIFVATGPLTMVFGVLANAVGQIINVLTKFFPKMQLATAGARAEALAHDLNNRHLVTQIGLKQQLTAVNARLAKSSQGVAASQAAGATTAGGRKAALPVASLTKGFKKIVAQLKLVIASLKKIVKSLAKTVVLLQQAATSLTLAGKAAVLAAKAWQVAATNASSVAVSLKRSAATASAAARSASVAAKAAAKAAVAASAAASAAATAAAAPVGAAPAAAAAAVAAQTAAAVSKPIAQQVVTKGAGVLRNAAQLAIVAAAINAGSIAEARKRTREAAVHRSRLKMTSGYAPLGAGQVVTQAGTERFARDEMKRIAAERSRTLHDRPGSVANVTRRLALDQPVRPLGGVSKTGRWLPLTATSIMPRSIREAYLSGQISREDASILTYDRRMQAQERLAERRRAEADRRLTGSQQAKRRKADRLVTDVLTDREMQERSEQARARNAAGRSGYGAPLMYQPERIEDRVTPAHTYSHPRYVEKPGESMAPVRKSIVKEKYKGRRARSGVTAARYALFTTASGATLSRKEIYDLNKVGYRVDEMRGPVWPEGHPKAGSRIPTRLFRKAGIPYPTRLEDYVLDMDEKTERVARPEGPRQPVVQPTKPSRIGPAEAERKARGPVLKPAKTPTTPTGKPRLISPITGNVIPQKSLNNPLVTSYTLDKKGNPRWPSGHPKAGQLIPKKTLERYGISAGAAAATAAASTAPAQTTPKARAPKQPPKAVPGTLVNRSGKPSLVPKEPKGLPVARGTYAPTKEQRARGLVHLLQPEDGPGSPQDLASRRTAPAAPAPAAPRPTAAAPAPAGPAISGPLNRKQRRAAAKAQRREESRIAGEEKRKRNESKKTARQEKVAAGKERKRIAGREKQANRLYLRELRRNTEEYNLKKKQSLESQKDLKKRLRAHQAARQAGLMPVGPYVGGEATPMPRALPSRAQRVADARIAKARHEANMAALKERLRDAQSARKAGQAVPPVVGGPAAPTARQLPNRAARKAAERTRAARIESQRQLADTLRNQQAARRAGLIAPPVVGGPAAPTPRALPSPAARRHAARQASAAAAAAAAAAPIPIGQKIRNARAARAARLAGSGASTPLHHQTGRGPIARLRSLAAATRGAHVVPLEGRKASPFLGGVSEGAGAVRRGGAGGKRIGGSLFRTLFGLTTVLGIVNKHFTTLATRLPIVGKALAGLMSRQGVTTVGALAVKGAGMAFGAMGAVGSAISVPLILTFGAFAMMNRDDLIAGFRSTFGDAFSRLKDSFDLIGDQIRYIIYLFRESSGSGGGAFAKIAKLVGMAAGVMVRVFANSLNVVMTLVQVILKAFDFLLKLMSGDMSGAAKSFGQLLKLAFIGVLEVVLSIIEVMTMWIPGASRLTEWARGHLAAWKNTATAIDDGTKNLMRMQNELRNMDKIVNGMTQEVDDFGKELERWQRYDIVTDEDLADLAAILDEFGRISDADEISQEIIIDAMLERVSLMGHLNDQMKQELVAGLMRNRIQEESNEMLEVSNQIYEAAKIEQRYERELAAHRKQVEERERLELYMLQLEEKLAIAKSDTRNAYAIGVLEAEIEGTRQKLENVLEAETQTAERIAVQKAALDGIANNEIVQMAVKRAHEEIKIHRQAQLDMLNASLSRITGEARATTEALRYTRQAIRYLEGEIAKPPSLQNVFNEYEKIFGDIKKLFDGLPDLVGGQIEIAGIVRAKFDGEDLPSSVNVNADFSKFVSAFKSGMSEVTGEINEALSKVISNQANMISDYFKDLSDASKDYFDEFKKNLKNQVKAIIEAAEEQIEQEIKIIDELADAKIEAIELEIEKEVELDKLRERLFNREKARIDYLSGRRTTDIKIQEALLRGDLAEAAIMRIEQQAMAEEYYLDLIRSREEEIKEARDKARDEEKKRIEEQRGLDIDAAKDRLEEFKDGVDEAMESAEEEIEIAKDLAQQKINAAKEAADEAREREEQRIQNYLKQWNKITPATEQEFRRHVAALEAFLENSGKNLQKEINSINDALRADLTEISNEFLSNNQELAQQIMGLADTTGMEIGQLGQDMIDIFQNTFRSSLSSIQIFVNGFKSGMLSAEALSKQFLRTFEYDMISGFDRARNLAIAALIEQDKWEAAGASIARALGRGFDGIGGPGTGGKQNPQPAPSPAPIPWSFPIQEGARGDHVKQLQTALRNAGWDPGPIDGIFGMQTKRAVMDFQNAAWNAQEWWKVNNRQGIVTQQEWVALGAANAKVGSSTGGGNGLGGDIRWFHSGGLVGGGPGDVPAVLQTGEYVINRKAVSTLGTSFLDKLNAVNARFSSPRVRSLSMKKPDMSSGQSNVTYNLSFQIDGANIDENRLAQEVMFRIKKAERASGSDRRVYG